MIEIKNENSPSKDNSLGVDFELDAMSYALKDLPAQNKTISLEKNLEGENKKNLPPQPEEKTTLPKEKLPEKETFLNEKSPNELQEALNKFPIPNPTKEKVSSSKSPLLTIGLSVVLLLCLAGGVFYYLKYLSPKESPEEAAIIPTTPSPSPIIEKTPLPLPSFSSQVEELSLTNENLSERLLALKQSSIDNPALKETLSTGVFYEIKKDGQTLTAQELLQALDISFPVDLASTFERGWLFAIINQQNILKIGLIFDITEDSFANSVVLNLEKDLPLMLKNLFLEEDSTVQDTDIVFQNNTLDIRLRFFNFAKDDSSRTIDWAKIGDYLFFTTSKDTAFQLIPLLEKESVE